MSKIPDLYSGVFGYMCYYGFSGVRSAGALAGYLVSINIATMPLPSSPNPISLNDLQNEFGGSNPAAITEYYAGSGLVYPGTVNESGTPIPSGGTISLSNFRGAAGFYIWDFVGSTSWIAPRTGNIYILLVGGGGGGGSILGYTAVEGGGGGGAGGVIAGQYTVTEGATYTINIGAGGAAGGSWGPGGNGGDSAFVGPGVSLLAYGGGGGGGLSPAQADDAFGALRGKDGGSGGGACAWFRSSYGTTAGSSIAGQGSSGSLGQENFYSGGGGGRADGANQNGGGGVSYTYTAPTPNSLSFGPYQLATGGGGGNSYIGTGDPAYGPLSNSGNGGQPWGGSRTGSGYGRAASFGGLYGGFSSPGYPNSGGGGGGGSGARFGTPYNPGSAGGSGRCVIWLPAAQLPSITSYATEAMDPGASAPPDPPPVDPGGGG